MIRIEGVTHRIGPAPILHDIDLTLPRGKLIALIGPNGAGKSTLLRLVARLEPLQAGRITVDGLDIATTAAEKLALTMAVMGQQTHIASRLRVAELVGFGRWPHHHGRPCRADREAVDRALAAFDLQPLAHRFLDEISGGQDQRAHLAMTFAQGTDWLLLDEPLNNLDVAHSRALMARLADLVRRETCADVAKSLGLLDAIKLGTVGPGAGARLRMSVLGDICEAVIGAIYLDGGYAAAM
ncbi:MAG TPA: ATP-binding cassette domain-containing protein, partial [Paracoccus sp. (in: a-proteobacteria)]|nr:ATP-binding cassette domain-containing protein [Paracoccus sp. (in: a-proteobacteria)]